MTTKPKTPDNQLKGLSTTAYEACEKLRQPKTSLLDRLREIDKSLQEAGSLAKQAFTIEILMRELPTIISLLAEAEVIINQTADALEKNQCDFTQEENWLKKLRGES